MTGPPATAGGNADHAFDDAMRLVQAVIAPEPVLAVSPAPTALSGRIEIALAGGDRVSLAGTPGTPRPAIYCGIVTHRMIWPSAIASSGGGAF